MKIRCKHSPPHILVLQVSQARDAPGLGISSGGDAAGRASYRQPVWAKSEHSVEKIGDSSYFLLERLVHLTELKLTHICARFI